MTAWIHCHELRQQKARIFVYYQPRGGSSEMRFKFQNFRFFQLDLKAKVIKLNALFENS